MHCPLKLSLRAELNSSQIVSTTLLTRHQNLLDSATEGFGYRWCSSLRFEDLVAKRSFSISCPHNDQQEAPFRFQAWVQADASDPAAR